MQKGGGYPSIISPSPLNALRVTGVGQKKERNPEYIFIDIKRSDYKKL